MINWPIPTFVGEIYTYNNKSWKWNGKAWVSNMQGISSIEIQDKLLNLENLIEMQNNKNNLNSFLLAELYNKILDIDEFINFFINQHKQPIYNICAKPETEIAIVIRPKKGLTLSSNRINIKPKPEIVKKSSMIWRNYLELKKKQVPILGVGSFYQSGNKLVDIGGKDLCEYLPVHFNKKIDNIVYQGIVDYEFIGGDKGREGVHYQYKLKYQIYNLATGTTEIFDGGVFNWQEIADNKLIII